MTTIIISMERGGREPGDNRLPDAAEQPWDDALKGGGWGSAPEAPAGGDALPTLREDLLAVRASLLGGDAVRALRQVDWTLDCLDQYLAEG